MTLDRRTLLTSLAALPVAAGETTPVRIPFQRDGGMVVVDVIIEGRPALAVIDNGAAFSVLDQAFAAAIGKPGAGRMRLNGGSVRVAASVGVSIGGVRIATSPAISDLSQFAGALGRPVAMMLGYELFATGTVQLDFELAEMTLHGAGFSGPPGLKPISLTALPGRKFAVPMRIGRKPVQAMVDLGAASAVAVSAELAARLDLPGKRRQSTAAASVFIGDQPRLFVSRLITAPALQLAGLTLRGAPLEILGADETVFSRYGVTVGAPVLTRYDLWLDLPGKRMWARPNGRAGAPFERDRIGLQGYMDGAGFRIMHVREKSPAWQAGLSSSDRVVTVNQKPAGEAIVELKYAAPAGRTYELGLAGGRQISLTAADFY